MKNLILLLLILLSPLTCFAEPLQKIIFFGDSLTDYGNLYRDTLHLIPKSPPYYHGRFSNGPTWAENVGNYYQTKNGMQYSSYAWAGATIAFHWPSRNFTAPISLNGEIKLYLLRSIFTDRSHDLFVIWIGDNDYIFFPGTDLQATTTNSLNNLSAAIVKLINHGAKHFLILNLTDASIAPSLRNLASTQHLHDLIVLHNQKLKLVLSTLRAAYPQIAIADYDAYSFFNDYVANYPKYNRDFNVHIKDNVTACLPETTSMPAEPCSDADAHIYWDTLHPTEPFHYILGRLLVNKIEIDILKDHK